MRKGFTVLREPANRLGFAVRRRLRWQRGRPDLLQEPKDDLFGYLDAGPAALCTARERQLRRDYALQPLRDRSTRSDYRDALDLLANLESLCRGVALQSPLTAVDVGARNWSYVFALERFLRGAGGTAREVELTGVEIDGYGVYRDLRSRADHAAAYVAQLDNPRVNYRVADFLQCEFAADVITLFFPFLTRYPLLVWGLPLSVFRPRELIAHALRCLRPGGMLVVFNQTSAERDILHRLLAELGAVVERCESLHSRMVAFHTRTADRWGTLARLP
ncbi:MAG: hypothetical protein KDC87_14575 [Planctomycetes bacterium]|nr:hypothetical protein [Planctomycetota bacterium]